MASIKCGHCHATHTSVAAVRDCALEADGPNGIEVCCPSCDATKGYATTNAEADRIALRRCGCDSNEAVYYEFQRDEDMANMAWNSQWPLAATA